MNRTPVKALALTAALLCAGSAQAETATEAKLLKLIEQLNARLDKLEQRNAELEKQVKGTPPQASSDVDRRLRTLEEANAKIDKSLDADTISENEPELTARLKAVEKDTLGMRKAAGKVEALEGVAIGASLTTVAQRPSGLPKGTLDGNSQLNYRADITAELPLESFGDIDHKLFAHFRMGQGLGLNTSFSNLSGFASGPNAVAFRASGANPDDSVAVLGEAWYQASIPLPRGGFKPASHEALELTFGKMDIFGFFDKNVVAGDESRQFLNSIFVHNPLLDAGGEAGVDANGFQPGIVASYVNHEDRAEPWRLSFGVFGTGRGANYSRFFSSPLVIAQAEKELKFDGLAGNYRAYYWRNGQGNQLDGTINHHAGWGLSIDQRVSDDGMLFARYGQLQQGQVPFDRALTLGGELLGSTWGRGGDVVGFAAGWLRASSDYRAAGGVGCVAGDVNGDGICDAADSGFFAFTPSGAEKVAELYYRYRITKQFELSPDLQYVWNMGSNPGADNVLIYGLRAQVSY